MLVYLRRTVAGRPQIVCRVIVSALFKVVLKHPVDVTDSGKKCVPTTMMLDFQLIL